MKKLIILAVVAGVIISALWYFLLFSPTQSSISKTQSQQIAITSKDATLQQQLSSLQAETKTLPSKMNLLSKLQAAIPTTPQLENILFTINKDATANSVTVTSISPQQPALPPPTSGSVKVTPLPYIKTAISVSGSYHNILHFMHSIATSPRILKIYAVNLVSATKGSTVTINAQLSVKAYVNTHISTGAP